MQNTCLNNNKKKCVGDNEAMYQLFFLSTKHISVKYVLNVHGIKKRAMKIKLHEDLLARYF